MEFAGFAVLQIDRFMVDKQSMYMDSDTLKNQTIRANWLLCVIIVLCNLLGHCLPGRAQSADPTGHLILVDHYEEDFSTDKVRYDSKAHSVIWVDGAYPPESPYLLLSQMGSNDGP